MTTEKSPVKVSFSGIAIPLDDVQENPAAFVRQLERAKINPGYAQCLCRGTTAPLRLQIRRYGCLFHLAGWPDEGPLHDRLSCSFHKDPSNGSNESGKALPGIVATAAGLRAKLDVALTQRTVGAVSKGPRQVGAPTTSRRSAPLLGFLQTLWQVAGLNRWSGVDRARNWGVCNARVLAEISDAFRASWDELDRAGTWWHYARAWHFWFVEDLQSARRVFPTDSGQIVVAASESSDTCDTSTDSLLSLIRVAELRASRS